MEGDGRRGCLRLDNCISQPRRSMFASVCHISPRVHLKSNIWRRHYRRGAERVSKPSIFFKKDSIFPFCVEFYRLHNPALAMACHLVRG